MTKYRVVQFIREGIVDSYAICPVTYREGVPVDVGSMRLVCQHAADLRAKVDRLAEALTQPMLTFEINVGEFVPTLEEIFP